MTSYNPLISPETESIESPGGKVPLSEYDIPRHNGSLTPHALIEIGNAQELSLTVISTRLAKAPPAIGATSLIVIVAVFATGALLPSVTV